ncbi:DUF1257 domain-containing protein [Actinomadura decatromicini]|uniref:DUF1257 domain-containing protein n=1 Tax=Actinomadura decatromicini TaxID=2604572 RepID=A0A5D3FW52_9ACTN|nr:DUF1257 domain-containing protein [Actinomadura decatromicini]TYK52551.1 DUF1257 domain-containing protein [Actinomadura decatromicini]
MSHFTKVRTRLTDGGVLRRALAEMGHTVQPAGRGVRGYLGRRTKAEFKIRPAGGEHEIGFAPSDEGYVLVADWWGIRGLREEPFVRDLKQKYALVSTLSTLAERGFEVDRRSVDEKSGDIRVVLRRVAV